MKRILCIWLPQWASQRRRVAAPVRPDGPPDPTDRQALEQLAEECRRYSPVVGVEEGAPPERIFLDGTGLDRLFGSERAWAEGVWRALRHRGLTAHLALADTLGGAWALSLAKAAARPPRRASLALPGGGGDVDPAAPAIVPAGETLAALRPLPLAVLRLPSEIVDVLGAIGVRRVEQLERIPPREWTSRFDPLLLQRWNQAIGQVDEPIPGLRPAVELSLRQDLEYPTGRREVLEPLVGGLVGQLAERLRQHGVGAMRLECVLESPPGPVVFSVGLFQPTAAAQHLLPLVTMHFERLRLFAPVSAVEVQVSSTAPLPRRQQEFFEAAARWQPRQWAGLIDRLSNRLGRQAVLRPRLSAEAQPELAYTLDPWIGEAGGRRRSFRREPVELPPRPLRLVSPPVALEVVAVAPQGPPILFGYRGRQHRIAATWGPERIETGWWRGRAIGRDYYQVETSGGERFWLYHRIEDNENGEQPAWYLHGLFE